MDLDLGPLIRASQQQRVWDFLSDAQVAGIAVVAQGQIVEDAPDSGFYQAPTLLRDVPPEHRLAQEEIFGPVLCAMPFHDEDHAVQLANGTAYGLVAGLDRKSTRLNSSHLVISYAVFCLKKKNLLAAHVVALYLPHRGLLSAKCLHDSEVMSTSTDLRRIDTKADETDLLPMK